MFQKEEERKHDDSLEEQPAAITEGEEKIAINNARIETLRFYFCYCFSLVQQRACPLFIGFTNLKQNN